MRKFRKLFGHLRHSAIGVTDSKGWFQPLNTDLQHNPIRIYINPTSEISLTLEDWLTLLNDKSQRPTSVHERLPGNPQYVEFTYASELDVGGLWTSGKHHFPLFLDSPFPRVVPQPLGIRQK